jgi:hypothetical protein
MAARARYARHTTSIAVRQPLWTKTNVGDNIARIPDEIEPFAGHFFFPFLADFLLSRHPECVKRRENASTFLRMRIARKFANANCRRKGAFRRRENQGEVIDLARDTCGGAARAETVLQAARGEITVLLAKWKDGEPSAFQELMPLVYPHLREVAAAYIRRERNPDVLQGTALVHELYLRLLNQKKAVGEDRGHFYTYERRSKRSRHVRITRSAAHRGLRPDSFSPCIPTVGFLVVHSGSRTSMQ